MYMRMKSLALSVRHNPAKQTLLKTINRTIELEPKAAVSGSVKIDGTDVKSM